MTIDTAVQWTVQDLAARLDGGEDFFILDVRNRDEFEAGRIEGRRPLSTVNVPYFEMLEEGGAYDFVDSVVDYVKAKLTEKLPKDREILAVCAKGDTSEFVAQALGKLDFTASNLEGGTAAWGNYYTVQVVVEAAHLKVYQVVRQARGCLSYVVVSDGKGVVIDPLRHVEHYKTLAAANGFSFELILDTHGHADHISGGPALAGELDLPYHLHPYDGIHPIDVLPAEMTYEYLKGGSEFQVGQSKIEVLHIPGHTLGNSAFLLDSKYLFTGDSIFIRSIARPDLGGHGETWAPIHYRSLARLMELPDDTIVLPAHFSSPDEADGKGVFAAKLGELKSANDGLRMVEKGEAEFVKYILASLPKFPDEYVEIKRVNAGLSRPDEEEAAELELGKNICALSQAYEAVQEG